MCALKLAMALLQLVQFALEVDVALSAHPEIQMHGLGKSGGECRLGDGFHRCQATAAGDAQHRPGMLRPQI